MHFSFHGEVNWRSTVFERRTLVLYCFQEKGNGAALYIGERKCCCIKFSS